MKEKNIATRRNGYYFVRKMKENFTELTDLFGQNNLLTT